MSDIISFMNSDEELSKLMASYGMKAKDDPIDAMDMYVKFLNRLIYLINPPNLYTFTINFIDNVITELWDLGERLGYNLFNMMNIFYHFTDGYHFTGITTELKTYIFHVESPVDIEVIDDNLKHSGYINGNIIDNIENSHVRIDGSKKSILILDDSNSNYIVKLMGTDEGKFSFYTYTTKIKLNTIAEYKDIPVNKNSIGILETKNSNLILNMDFDGDEVIDQIILPTYITISGENLYNLSFLPPVATTDKFNLSNGSTLPIKFTARDNNTGEFIYDDTVNVTITNATGSIITNFNTANGVQIDSDLEEYAVDFNTMDYPELTIGETCAIQVTFGDVNSPRGFAITYFTLVDRTPPSTITHPHPTAGTTHINWTWTNPPDPDFNHTEIYLNGAFKTITSAEHYNATDLTPETSYTIGTRTVDTAGNISQRWVNDTATTLSTTLPTPTPPPTPAPTPINYEPVPAITPYGMLSLIALLALAGFVVLRRKE